MASSSSSSTSSSSSSPTKPTSSSSSSSSSSPKKLPSFLKPQPVAPILPKPIAPFAGKSRRKIAVTAARYYGECALQGICPKDADNAAKESQAHFENWWLQNRFKKNDKKTPPVVALKRRRSLTDIHNNNNNHSSGRGKNAKILSSSSPSSTNHGSVDRPPIPKRIIPDSKVKLEQCKTLLLQCLNDADGETNNPTVIQIVNELKQLYLHASHDPTYTTPAPSWIDGVWMTMSKPNFPDCLGKNPDGEYAYTLGRMSFDMFRPTGLQCTITGMFNSIFEVEGGALGDDDVPRKLKMQVAKMGGGATTAKIGGTSTTLRSYNIIVTFKINTQENNSSIEQRQPLHGLMTTYGYILPDPATPNRHTVFFTGGLLEPNDDADEEEWKRLFDTGLAGRLMKEKARQLASKVLLGANVKETIEVDGGMSYKLSQPIGAHGQMYVDTIYLDESLRVMRGQTGSLYVLSRVPPQLIG